VGVLQATASKPLLVHCTKGTHRTGCIVGCLRKLEVFFFILGGQGFMV
jgi:protein tyrosine/serine phosphatase